jgi:hypothetical protein
MQRNERWYWWIACFELIRDLERNRENPEDEEKWLEVALVAELAANYSKCMMYSVKT